MASPLPVHLGSLGAEVRYNLMTRNISTTGFFLDFPKPGRFPFSPASIMEVWLETGAGPAIFFNGRMTRIVFPSDAEAAVTGPGIAVKIVQISKEEDIRLKNFISAGDGASQDNQSDIAS